MLSSPAPLGKQSSLRLFSSRASRLTSIAFSLLLLIPSASRLSAENPEASSGFVLLPSASTPTANFLSVADLNHDGHPDLVTARQNNYVSNGTFKVQLADPAKPGQFLAPVEYDLYGSPLGVVSGDFNKDGVPDLIFLLGSDYPNGLDQGKIEVFLGNPTQPGSFQTGTTFPVGILDDSPEMPLNSGFTVGDFNRDGLLDIAVLNSGDTGSIGILLGDPAHPGSFQTPTSVPLGNYFPNVIKTADFNRDGFPDLALGVTSGDLVTVVLADPKDPGHFFAPINYPVSTQGTNTHSTILIGDMNKDGLPDIVVPQAQSIAVVLNNPATPGTLLAAQNYASTQPLGATAIGDFNGDGFLDIASQVSNGLQVLYGRCRHQSKHFQQVVYPLTLPTGTLLSTDFNRDGVSDLVAWSLVTNTVQVALGTRKH